VENRVHTLSYPHSMRARECANIGLQQCINESRCETMGVWETREFAFESTFTGPLSDFVLDCKYLGESIWLRGSLACDYLS